MSPHKPTAATTKGPLGKVLVIIPTYNEADNLGPIVSRLRAAVPEADVLIADDNSPDGTGRIADELAAKDDHVHVLHREAKQGLGATYVAGFRWGLERGYGVLVEHDADGSHQPEQLPRLLEALSDADMVKGSRWVKGGSVKNWPWHRELLSRGGSLWSRLALGLPIKDVTGGFTAFRAETLQGIGLDDIEAAGYAFQVDLARRAIARGYKVVEVPIEFIEREKGDSKMSSRIVAEAMLLTTRWGAKHRFDQAKQYLGFAGTNARQLADEVGERVGPGVRKVADQAGRLAGDVSERLGPEAQRYAEQAGKLAGEVGQRAVQEAQRLATEARHLADQVGDRLGPEVEKYAKEASRLLSEVSAAVRAQARQLQPKDTDEPDDPAPAEPGGAADDGEASTS